MFKVFILAVVAICISLVVANKFAERSDELFVQFEKKHSRTYSSSEERSRRKEIFKQSMIRVDKKNELNGEPVFGVTKFSDWTLDEFKVLLGRKKGNPNPRSKNVDIRTPADAEKYGRPYATTFDPVVNWLKAGVVTAVKNQGSCGSCWSFSTTGSLEGAYYLKYGTLKSFSEQELVSCDKTDLGCNGGWMDDAFTWVQQNGGITTEDAYPYTSGTTQQSGTCSTSGYVNDAKVAPSSYTDVQAGSVTALMSAVAQQPVSIAIQANQLAFQSYSGGVLTGKCGQRLDHGVLAVGYGTLNGVDYWKVKNSWGPTWGEAGYILIERSSADLCGVLDAASYPSL